MNELGDQLIDKSVFFLAEIPNARNYYAFKLPPRYPIKIETKGHSRDSLTSLFIVETNWRGAF